MQFRPWFIGLVCALAPTVNASDSGLQIILEGTPPSPVARYAKHEISFQLSRQYTNPFDSKLISVEALFVEPSGRQVRVPGFYFQEYPEPNVRNDSTYKGNAGQACWKVRYAPREVGTHLGKLIATDPGGQAEIQLPPLNVTPSDNPGFIRCTTGTEARTVFDSGRMFMPIGECLWMPRTLEQFEKEFALYVQNGMNYFRFFTSRDSMFHFENSSRPAGQYDLFILKQLDYLFDEIGRRGLYVMPCLEMFADFRVTQPYPYWAENPYNSKNGGPCKSVSDFFVNPEAKRLYKNRLRYFIARYGYSPNLFCLQLFAEANYIENYDMVAVRQWHQEMAAYLHSLDPYGHPVSTSMATWDSQDRHLFALPEIDLVLNENYNARDFAGELAQENADILAEYRKPAFLAEAGLTFESLGVSDESGLHIHNAIWANPLSGGLGVPSFWWGYYIREKKLLGHFKAFAAYIKGEDFTGLRPITARLTAGKGNKIYPDLIIPYPYIDPPGANGPQTIPLPNDRFINRDLPNLLHIFHSRTTPEGSTNSAFNPITFLTDFADNGNLIIHPRWIGGPTTSAVCLQVRIDDKLVKEIRYNGSPEADWNELLRRSREICVPTSVDVPKGCHQIRLENNGTLVMSASLDFGNYLKSDVANLRVLGLGDSERAYLWIQNRDNTWWRNYLGKKPRTIRKASITLTGMRDGPYDIQWWDTYQGRCTKRQRLKAHEGNLTLNIKDLEKDLACKIKAFRKAHGVCVTR